MRKLNKKTQLLWLKTLISVKKKLTFWGVIKITDYKRELDRYKLISRKPITDRDLDNYCAIKELVGAFKSHVKPHIWNKMTPQRRNIHKARQAYHKTYKIALRKKKRNAEFRLKKPFYLSKYPRNYRSVYRKTKLRKIAATWVMNDTAYETIGAIKSILTSAIWHNTKINFTRVNYIRKHF